MPNASNKKYKQLAEFYTDEFVFFLLKVSLLVLTILTSTGCKQELASNHKINTSRTCQLIKSQQVTALPSSLPYTVVQRYPHNPQAFSQGLVYDKGLIFESTGHYGQSTISKQTLASGKTLQQHPLAEHYFAEGLTLMNNTLVQLTWKSGKVLKYDADTLNIIEQQTIEGEGWGLTFDGQSLISSDGSSVLTWRDPETLEVKSTLNIHYGDRPLKNLNELEWVNGCILANIWLNDNIAVIDPVSGNTLFVIDLSPIARPERGSNPDHVANGIAYIPDRNKLLVTGKNWQYIYELKLHDE